MPVPDSISDYLRMYATELGNRILQSFPPLHAVDDPPSPLISKLLRKPFLAQTLAIMGLTCGLWQQARAGAVDCGVRDGENSYLAWRRARTPKAGHTRPW